MMNKEVKDHFVAALKEAHEESTLKHKNRINLTVVIKFICYLAIIFAAVLISIYFGLLIYEKVRVKSSSEFEMECLQLGSDPARQKCLNLLRESGKI